MIVRFLLLVVVIGVATTVSFFWLSDFVGESVTVNQDTRGRYEALVGSDYNIDKMKANYSQIQADLSELYGVLPLTEDVFKVIDQLEKIAEKNGLTQTIEVSDLEESVDGFSGIPIRVQLRGSQDSLSQYLKDLENLRYYIQEKSLEYDKKYTEVTESGQTSDGVNATMEAVIFTAPL